MPKMLRYVFLTLLAANVFVYWAVWSAGADRGDLTIRFLDVGQGDAQLIQTPAGNVLIDGGPSRRVVREIDKFLSYPDRTIDVMVMTHPNNDHIEGFVEVLKRYDVRLFVMTGVRYDTLKTYQEILQLLRVKQVPVLYAVAGQQFSLGGPSLQIVWPQEILKDTYLPREVLNDTSVVTKLSYDDFDALFTGDISAKVERLIGKLVGDIEVLKVAHHGSKYSSDKSFLGVVKPELAFIGVGRNSYGHPTGEALSRLAGVGAQAFRTDTNGSLSASLEGGVVKVVKTK